MVSTSSVDANSGFTWGGKNRKALPVTQVEGAHQHQISTSRLLCNCFVRHFTQRCLATKFSTEVVVPGVRQQQHNPNSTLIKPGINLGSACGVIQRYLAFLIKQVLSGAVPDPAIDTSHLCVRQCDVCACLLCCLPSVHVCPFNYVSNQHVTHPPGAPRGTHAEWSRQLHCYGVSQVGWGLQYG